VQSSCYWRDGNANDHRDTLSVRQEGRGSNCPFYLHLWTPIDSKKVRPGRQLAIGNENAELVDPYKPRKLSDARVDPRTVWANRGSSAMTTTGPVLLNPSNEYELAGESPVPSLPPTPPPEMPLPPMAPTLYQKVEVTAKYKSTNGDSVETVAWMLTEKKKLLDDAIMDVIGNITEIGFSLTSSISTGIHSALASEDLQHQSTLLTLTTTRRLSEEDCNNSAVLEMVITFDENVLASTIQQLEDYWPSPPDEWNVETCGNVTFNAIEAQPPEDDISTHLLLAIILAIVLVTAIFICTLWLCAMRRLRPSNENEYRQMEPAPGPPFDLGTFLTRRESRTARKSNAAGGSDSWIWSMH